MTPQVRQRTGGSGPVMAAMVGAAPAEAVLRDAFGEAERRGAAVRVVAAGPGSAVDDDFLRDLVDRWAEKYPGVPVTTDIRRRIDAAVTLVAATRRCAVVFVARISDPAIAAVLRAMTRRAHCPVVVVNG